MISKNSFKIAIAALMLFLSTSVFAAERVSYTSSQGVLQWMNSKGALFSLGVSKERELADNLGLSREDSLKLISMKDVSNLSHNKFQQYYKGIKVWGEQVVVSSNTRNLMATRLSGSSAKGLEKDFLGSDLTPALSAAEALSYVKSLNNKNKSYTANLKYHSEVSELVIYVDDAGASHLAYDVSYFADLENGGAPTKPTVLIDAKTKKVLLKYEGLTTKHAAADPAEKAVLSKAEGPGGNLKTGKYMYGKDFDFLPVMKLGDKCTMANKDVIAVDLNNTSSKLSAGFIFTCPENNHKEINGAYSPLNDAFAFGVIIDKMYKEWVGQAPLKFPLLLRVHYSTKYENAFWDGAAMHFGDGNTRFYPLVSMDVTAHEISHGFTQQNSNLKYSGKSGGINEAFSDIAGEAAEFYRRGKADFLIGSEVFKAEGKALRYMDDPTKDKKSIGSAKDYHLLMDVHHSSGVFNKAFYLLANTKGWDVKKAFITFATANKTYWTERSDFVAAAKGVADAAEDLGYSKEDVVRAFTGVDVEITE